MGTPDITHHGIPGRFVTEVDGHVANLDYEMADGRMHITHTRVPEAIGGRGIAGKLVEAAFHHARTEGWKVRPLCAYAEAWAGRHPEYADVLD
ncbi:GNAT family N-acetyltransferase [Luteimonas sp. MJ250]|uniref:GNAT family N-acetyltransferase n=1 Tax=Luteimonas sp. MJ250 TaxID=3129236 RepID=UPI0031BACE28